PEKHFRIGAVVGDPPDDIVMYFRPRLISRDDELLIFQIGPTHISTPGQRVVRRHRNVYAFLPKLEHVAIDLGCVASKEGNVDFTRSDPAKMFPSPTGTDFEKNTFELLLEGRDQFAQESPGEHGDDADLDRAGLHASGCVRMVQ